MPDPQQLPLRHLHASLGARFVTFGGWEMPVQYSSIIEEHKAVRQSAGLFDVSHMGEVHVTGPDATDYLDRLLVNSIGTAACGKAIYSPMCREDGGVVDDLIAYRISEDEFLLCLNAGNHTKDLEWMRARAEEWGLQVNLSDQSAAYALLALQGPEAASILEASGFSGVSNLGRFEHATWPLQPCGSVRICRTGYTGEDGFELFLNPAEAASLAHLLLENGSGKGLRPCGLGARDSLRLEAGLPLYGHELSDDISPLEAGLEWTVKLKKPEFVGKEALSRQSTSGLSRRVIHFRLAGRRIAREGLPVVNREGEKRGCILSGTHSPILGCPIGSALIETSADDSSLSVDLRGHLERLEILRPPLHRHK